MNEQCFYCQEQLENEFMFAQFFINNEEAEKPLCSDCYRDWLEGIKG